MHPLFSSPFRVMTFWAIPATCIVSHICSKEVISQTHKDSMSTVPVLAGSQNHIPKGIICVQQCFLFVKAVLIYWTRFSPGSYTEETIHFLTSMGGGFHLMNISLPALMPLSIHPQTEELPQGQKNKKVFLLCPSRNCSWSFSVPFWEGFGEEKPVPTSYMGQEMGFLEIKFSLLWQIGSTVLYYHLWREGE